MCDEVLRITEVKFTVLKERVKRLTENFLWLVVGYIYRLIFLILVLNYKGKNILSVTYDRH